MAKQEKQVEEYKNKRTYSVFTNMILSIKDKIGLLINATPTHIQRIDPDKSMRICMDSKCHFIGNAEQFHYSTSLERFSINRPPIFCPLCQTWTQEYYI